MSTPHIAAAPLIVALVTAILTLLLRRLGRVQRAVSLLGGAGYVAVVALLAARVFGGNETLVYAVSDWQAPYGIVLVADPLSAFMLALAAVVSFAALAYSVAFVSDFGQRLSYHPLFHFMMVGVSGAFLTGDVFNLFVWFEVMLMASYILVLFYSGPEHTRAALHYVVLNLLGSAVMLVAIGGLYATTGTLNMADIARRLAQPELYQVELLPVLGLSAVLFSVFALKAGLVPFHFWVPAAYRAAPAPVTAVLAGVVKKVGVYAIIRLSFTVFAAANAGSFALPGLQPATGGAFLGYFGPVLFVLGVASIFLGGIAAVGSDRLDDVLAFSSVSQVGFIVLPLAVAASVPGVRVLGITAALVYTLNHALAKALLFLVSGSLQGTVGTDRFAELGGVAGRAPVVAGAFLVGALSLVGIPPLVGFFGKFLVFRTAAEAWAVSAAGAGLAVAAALAGAVLTVAYYTRGWNQVFWGPTTERVRGGFDVLADGGRPGGGRPAGGDNGEGATDRSPVDAARVRAALRGLVPSRRGVPDGEVAVLVGLALAVVLVGVGVEPVIEAARMAAEAAVDTQRYVDAVAPGTCGCEIHEGGLLPLAALAGRWRP